MDNEQEDKLLATKARWTEQLLPEPQSLRQCRFIAEHGLHLYLLLRGAQQQLIAELQQQAENELEEEIIASVYGHWGWESEQHLTLSEISAASSAAAGNQRRRACLDLEQRHLIAINSSNSDPEVYPTWPPPDLALLSADIQALGPAPLRAGLNFYSPSELLISWGRSWQGRQIALARATEPEQQVLIERLFQHTLHHCSQPAANAEQLTFGLISESERLQPIRAQFAALAHKGVIELFDGAWPQNQNRGARYALNLAVDAAPKTPRQPDRSLRAIFSAQRPGSPGAPGLLAVLGRGLGIDDYLLLQGRLVQAWRIAKEQAADQLQQQVLDLLLTATRSDPSGHLPATGVSAASAAPHLHRYSPQEINSALQELQGQGLVRARQRSGGDGFDKLYTLLPEGAQGRELLTGRQPSLSQITALISDYGPEEYYFQQGRVLQVEAQYHHYCQPTWIGQLGSILSPLTRRALLDDQQRFLSLAEITAELWPGHDQLSVAAALAEANQRHDVIMVRAGHYALNLI